MRRIGIFGGTFDPPHVGHLISAEEVREQMNLEKVLFIPSAVPPLKEISDITDKNIRYEMTKLAVEGNKYFEASDVELKLSSETGGMSYTVNTLLALRAIYHKSQFRLYLIIGMDQLASLDRWYMPQKLFAMSEVIVINKPGWNLQDVKNEYVKQVIPLSVKHLEISSSDIRQRVREGRSIKYLVPESVERFIIKNKLYL
ncbi:MAG: nicotinate-nucleotide adenylyltransferase [Ignavibacteria bacterium]|nr:nicotinate-nucleotide adenylyltransferase [Ignavibacteria bacterium]